jgi:hypothetical protein
MPEIGTSGSMSGDGKRGVAEWPKLPRPSSTLPIASFREDSYFGRFWREADIELPLPNRVYEYTLLRSCGREPAARTITPSKTKPVARRQQKSSSVTSEGNRTSWVLCWKVPF